MLLPNQWSLRPTGKQVEVGNFPVNVALHPQGDWAAVLHSGYGPHEVVVVDLKTDSVVSRVTLPQDVLRSLRSRPTENDCWSAAAKTTSSTSSTLPTAISRTARSSIFPRKRRPRWPPAWRAATTASGSTRPAAWAIGWRPCRWNMRRNRGRSPCRREAAPTPRWPAAKTNRLYVSLWGKSSVAVVDRATEKIEATWPTASHPTEMVLSPDEDLLYVACADSNTVSVIDTKTGRQIEVITTSLYPQAPHGSTPNSLALRPTARPSGWPTPMPTTWP